MAATCGHCFASSTGRPWSGRRQSFASLPLGVLKVSLAPCASTGCADWARAAEVTSKPLHPVAVEVAPHGCALMHQQRLPEHAIAHEVHVLLHPDDVRRDSPQRLGDLRRKIRHQHVAEIGLGQIFESIALRGLDELVEVDGVVDFLEMLVEQVGVGLVRIASSSCRSAMPIGAVGGRALRQEIQQSAGLLDLLAVAPVNGAE